jgi:hypothetical protein
MAAAWYDGANKTKEQILYGADPGYVSARKVARNTVRILYENPFRIVFRYHATNVVTIYEDGLIVLNSGGFQTPTTKRRIEKYGRLRLQSHWIRRGYTIWILPDGRQFEDGIMWRALPDDPRVPEPPDEGEFGVINFDEELNIHEENVHVWMPPDEPMFWEEIIEHPDDPRGRRLIRRMGERHQNAEIEPKPQRKLRFDEWEPPGWEMPDKIG